MESEQRRRNRTELEDEENNIVIIPVRGSACKIFGACRFQRPSWLSVRGRRTTMALWSGRYKLAIEKHHPFRAMITVVT